MKKICELCSREFDSIVYIDGCRKNLQNRKYCLLCSPFESHNTKKLNKIVNSEYKICCDCKQTLPLSEFHKKDKWLHSKCKRCLYVYQIERWREVKQKALDYKGGKCISCGYDRCPDALCFHHRDRIDKEASWNKLRLRSWDKIKKEIDKCDLLCCNCHSETHYDINRR